MNPYASNPNRIPTNDQYADIPSYGRYCPNPDDFRVDLLHVDSRSPDSLRYWTSAVALCTEANLIYPADDGGRDVFALGNVIVKSSHLHQEAEIDFSYADANEIKAIDLARSVLKGDVRVPSIYFTGKVCPPALPHFMIFTQRPTGERPSGLSSRATSRRVP